MRTLRWLSRRIVATVTTLLGASVLVFVLLRAVPGNQITAQFGTASAQLTPAQLDSLRRYYGINKPAVEQFFSWLGNVFTGNLGYSTTAQESVLDMTRHALPVTAELALLSIVLAVAIGVPLGMFAASKPSSYRDGIGQVIGLAGLSLPVFLIGSLVLVVCAVSLGYNPNGASYASLNMNPVLNLQQMSLPTAVLGLNIAAPISRTARTAILEIRTSDFIRTAVAKGVPPRRVAFRHVLRNALIPITTMTSLQFGYLLGGVVVVENIFSLPGLGRQMLLSLQQQEYDVAQSTVLIIALIFVLVNLLTDITYRLIDPRVQIS